MSKTLYSTPQLYRATLTPNNKPKTTQWRAWVTSQDATVTLWVEYGTLGGKLIQTPRQVTATGRCKTLVDKGIFDAKKKWQDKQEKEGYGVDLPDVVPLSRVPSAHGLPSSTSGSGTISTPVTQAQVLPMLANAAKIDTKNNAIKGIDFPCFAQPKLDGIRCLVNLAPGNITLLSRKNKAFLGFPSLRKKLQQLVDAAMALASSSSPQEPFGGGQLYLDGELFVPGQDFSEMSGLIRKAQHSADADVPNIALNVFDCFDLSSPATPFHARLEYLKNLLSGTRTKNSVKLVPTVWVSSVADVNAQLANYLAEGHEGLMLRCPNGQYILRKRSKHLLKYKLFQDDEYKIIGFKEGAGDDAGTVVWQCQTADGKPFFVRPTGTREHRRELYRQAKEAMGQFLTVQYQELSKDGIPRFPVGKAVRWDKEC